MVAVGWITDNQIVFFGKFLLVAFLVDKLGFKGAEMDVGFGMKDFRNLCGGFVDFKGSDIGLDSQFFHCIQKISRSNAGFQYRNFLPVLKLVFD